MENAVKEHLELKLVLNNLFSQVKDVLFQYNEN